MPRTRTLGIAVDPYGQRKIDKEYRGIRIFVRLGKVPQRQTERRLRLEINRIKIELQRRANSHQFVDCATRYLVESQSKRTAKVIGWHIRLLNTHIGHLDINHIHDATLKPFITERLTANVSATTINRSLEVVRTILHRAARVYRDDRGRPWLNNTAWQQARKSVGLHAVRIHDLRHTFASRLRAVGVTPEDRQTLLGHSNSSMAGHYASADIGRLITQVNLILDRTGTRTVLRVANG